MVDNYTIDHPVNKTFVEGIFDKHPQISKALRADWLRVSKQSLYRDANLRLSRLHERLTLGNTGLFMDTPDHDVVSYCNFKSKLLEKDCIDFAKRGLKVQLFDYVVSKVREAGLEFPVDNLQKATDQEMFAAVKRVCDAKWWRRQIRKIQARTVEAVARDLRLVHARAGIYVSNYTARRRTEQRQRNRALLDGLEAVNQDDYCATLSQLSDLSVSNPENRRNELMVRIRGFEELAKDGEYAGLFLTLTCPSKYHAFLSVGAPNPKYQGATPRDGNQYLNRVWSLIRSAWDKVGVKPYGFRVVEPHHDGTPHWHLMLFIEHDKKREAIEIFRAYAMREDGNERGAKKYRTKIVEIDPARGTASGYIAKYISKNIDGYAVDADLYGRDAKTSAKRIEAWASTWGIRQFQQIGGASVTVWRELRRVSEEMLEGHSEKVLKVRKAADEADWAAFTMLMGGVRIPRGSELLRPLYLPSEEKNQYGEFVEVLKGVFSGCGQVVTRFNDWVIQKAGTYAEKALQAVSRFSRANSRALQHLDISTKLGGPVHTFEGFYHAPGTGRTWTCVNNCTGREPPNRIGADEQFIFV